MLIDKASESRIKQLIDALGSSIATYLIGRDLGQTRTESLSSALGARKLTSLEQSFLAGKVASLIGPEDLKRMSTDETAAWIQQHDVRLTDAEQAQLKGLRNDTEKWIEGRTADWKKTFNQVLASADKEWRGVIAKGGTTDAQARTTARNAALGELVSTLRDESTDFTDQVHRLVQTETHHYFQQGQASAWDDETVVYKIPRPNACERCQQIHLKADGSPRLYRLADVDGASNVGQPAYSWGFTIGPTHPWCYCILYSTTQHPPPEADEERAEARANALKKAAYILTPTTLEQLRKAHEHGEELPPHQQTLLTAIKKIYGEDPPPH